MNEKQHPIPTPVTIFALLLSPWYSLNLKFEQHPIPTPVTIFTLLLSPWSSLNLKFE